MASRQNSLLTDKGFMGIMRLSAFARLISTSPYSVTRILLMVYKVVRDAPAGLFRNNGPRAYLNCRIGVYVPK